MRVLDLLDHKKKWTKKRHAADKRNRAVAYDDRRAVKWRLSAAVSKCYQSDASKLRALGKLQNAIEKYTSSAQCMIVGFNDHPEITFKDIRAVLEIAKI